MEKKTALKYVSIISFIGVLFSGYLSFGTVISGVCPLNGECPFFLGYPACYFGLAMFLMILIASLMSFLPKQNKDNLIKAILAISFMGILFSGYFSLIEILNPRNYSLILPTCVYALIMYILVFIIPLLGLLKKK
jgi:uncharacterized membrane protein